MDEKRRNVMDEKRLFYGNKFPSIYNDLKIISISYYNTENNNDIKNNED